MSQICSKMAIFLFSAYFGGRFCYHSNGKSKIITINMMVENGHTLYVQIMSNFREKKVFILLCLLPNIHSFNLQRLSFYICFSYILMCMYLEMIRQYIRALSCEPKVYVPSSASELRVKLILLNMFKPFSDFLLTVSRRCFFCGPFLLFMFIFV